MRKNTDFGEFDEGGTEVDGGYGNIESAKSSRRWVIYMKKVKKWPSQLVLELKLILNKEIICFNIFHMQSKFCELS